MSHSSDAAGVMEIRSRPGSNNEPDGQPRERVDADELVARVIAQVPDPRRHLIHAYGWYANAARAKRKRDASNAAPTGASESSGPAIVASGEIGAIQIVAWPQRDEECGPARSGGVRERDSDPRRK